jgi:hypothetical protein
MRSCDSSSRAYNRLCGLTWELAFMVHVHAKNATKIATTHSAFVRWKCAVCTLQPGANSQGLSGYARQPPSLSTDRVRLAFGHGHAHC